MDDIYVKCCRCKNLHLHSERKEGRVDKRFGTRPLVCPRCGGHSYFKAEEPAQPQKGEG